MKIKSHELDATSGLGTTEFAESWEGRDAHFVFSSLGASNPVVEVTVAPVKVENKYQVSSLKNDHFVPFVFP